MTLNLYQKILDELFTLAQDVEPIKTSRLAACIVHKRSIISYGFNQLKTHPFQAQYTRHENAIYLHAETDAIKNALKRIPSAELSKTMLFVVRAKLEKGKWVYGLSKPCEGCMKAVATFDIKDVVYTTDEGDYKYM